MTEKNLWRLLLSIATLLFFWLAFAGGYQEKFFLGHGYAHYFMVMFSGLFSIACFTILIVCWNLTKSLRWTTIVLLVILAFFFTAIRDSIT